MSRVEKDREIKEIVLELLKEREGKPLSFKEISWLIGLGRAEQKTLKRILREMQKEGSLILTRRGLYGPPEEMNLITGRFISHKDGYGFVSPEKTGLRDIFIPPRATLGSLDGDRVVVRVENPQKREGRVIRILERAQKKIAGFFEEGRTASFVRPKNKAIPFDIYIPPKEKGGAKTGDSVIVEFTTYPGERRQPSGKIIKVLGKPIDPSSEIESIVEEFGLPKRFPKEVSEDAKTRYSIKSLGKRRDLTRLNTITIDGERAKDFDDAVSIKLWEYGYTLYVHIADVGFYVRWHDLLDMEAKERATSVYLPDRVIPMLPRELSEDLCSLKPDVERPAITVQMNFDRAGIRHSAVFYPSLIKSNERMTYTSVRKILIDLDQKERARYEYLLPDIELMAELTSALRSKRLQRGSLDFDLPEPEVILDLTGRPEAILRAERNFAHMMIEEFMIAANEAVAEYIESLGVPSLYRIHEPPDSTRLDEIWEVVGPLIGKKHIKPKGSISPQVFSSLLNEVKGRAEEEAVNYIILRSMKQARYSTENVGHFGLASKCYTHFTSPIRRYPDLVVHRILREVLEKKTLPDKRLEELNTILPEIASHSSYMERRADESEQAAVDAMRVWLMKDHLGDEFKARIVGITPYGMRIRLQDIYVEGFLHLSYMTDDFYIYDPQGLTLTGRRTKRTFKIGQEIRVRLERVDMTERELVFARL